MMMLQATNDAVRQRRRAGEGDRGAGIRIRPHGVKHDGGARTSSSSQALERQRRGSRTVPIGVDEVGSAEQAQGTERFGVIPGTDAIHRHSATVEHDGCRIIDSVGVVPPSGRVDEIEPLQGVVADGTADTGDQNARDL